MEEVELSVNHFSSKHNSQKKERKKVLKGSSEVKANIQKLNKNEFHVHNKFLLGLITEHYEMLSCHFLYVPMTFSLCP